MGHIDNSDTAIGNVNMDIKVYTKRWFLLMLFMLYTANVGMPWMQFASITHIVADYYHVPKALVEMTSIVVMAARAFLLIPALFLMDKLNTKNTLVLGSTLCLIGSCVKAFSVSPDKFHIVMIGQLFSALALVFTYSLIGRFSAAWFSADEISKAGAFSCIGEILGCAIGFLLPGKFVPETTNAEEVEKGMRHMHYFYTACALVTTILIMIFFKSKPKRPPSAAQAHFRSNKNQRVYESVKSLLGCSNFVMFVITQGVFVGCGSNAVNTLLNEMIVTNFPGEASDHAGSMGCANLFAGILGSVVLSYIQDRNRKFKCMAVALSMANTVSLSLFFISLKMGRILYVYITFSIFGFLMQGYYSTTIQMGIELAFPIPEGITVAATSVCVEVVSMTSTSIYGFSMRTYGDWKTNICTVILLFLSTIAVSLVPPNFKREEIERVAKSAEVKGLISGSEKKPIVTTSTTTVCERPTG